MKGTGPFKNRDYYLQDMPRALFSNLPIGFDQLCDYHYDFIAGNKSLNDATNELIVVKDASASVLMGTGDVENGAITITSAATTDNDGGSFQRAETTFLCKSGKELWFEAKVKVSDADQGEMFVGLSDNFATDPEAVIVEGVARVGFELIDGAATINTVVDNDTAATKTVLSVSMSDATYVRLGFRTMGDYVLFYVNRSYVGRTAIPSAIAAVTLGPAFMHISGNDTGTHTAALEYLLAVQERG
jgi:hypothetical protein